ncbi:MAG: excinuclease ABC subunit A [Deltaproteobacteria bacterium]|nr:excinuclease ABC subunit A [Deltaproteobacteria bacterium]
MHTATTSLPSPFWLRWLVVAAAIVIGFGASMVLAPGPTRQLFGLLLFASPDGVNDLAGAEAAYVSLVHAILGATMVGWGVLLLLVVLGPFRRGSAEAWRMLVASLAAWFVPDTAFSLASGFWPNAVLNAGFVVLFAVPLLATRGARGGAGG